MHRVGVAMALLSAAAAAGSASAQTTNTTAPPPLFQSCLDRRAPHFLDCCTEFHVALKPYWMLVIEALLLALLIDTVPFVASKIKAKLKQCCRRRKRIETVTRVIRTGFPRFGLAVITFQGLSALIRGYLLIHKVNTSPHVPHSGFQHYNNMVFLLTNSSLGSAVISFLSRSFGQMFVNTADDDVGTTLVDSSEVIEEDVYEDDTKDDALLELDTPDSTSDVDDAPPHPRPEIVRVNTDTTGMEWHPDKWTSFACWFWFTQLPLWNGYLLAGAISHLMPGIFYFMPVLFAAAVTAGLLFGCVVQPLSWALGLSNVHDKTLVTRQELKQVSLSLKCPCCPTLAHSMCSPHHDSSP